MEQAVAALHERGTLGDGGLTVAVGEGVVTATLSNPSALNALGEKMMDGLSALVELLHGKEGSEVRAVVLTGKGRLFCSGADTRELAKQGRDAIARSADVFSRVLRQLNTLPQLVIGLANGPAYGGGVGLLACCDIVVAPGGIPFSFSEVKLGMIPATISPYVLQRIPQAVARRLFMTGEKFSTEQAREYLFVDYVVPVDGHAAFVAKLLKDQGACAPFAVRKSKELVFGVAGRPIDASVVGYTVQALRDVRAGSEVREGVRALSKREKPKWAGVPLSQTKASKL
eukprot:Rhum_TRINITY_DN12142_c1_g1::Rhum_TRINITY_DN12142_c1_g1_i1::g.49287::m.49287/K13766/liuC; methylglutaconyl-CoA hydratase